MKYSCTCDYDILRYAERLERCPEGKYDTLPSILDKLQSFALLTEIRQGHLLDAASVISPSPRSVL